MPGALYQNVLPVLPALRASLQHPAEVTTVGLLHRRVLVPVPLPGHTLGKPVVVRKPVWPVAVHRRRLAWKMLLFAVVQFVLAVTSVLQAETATGSIVLLPHKDPWRLVRIAACPEARDCPVKRLSFAEILSRAADQKEHRAVWLLDPIWTEPACDHSPHATV